MERPRPNFSPPRRRDTRARSTSRVRRTPPASGSSAIWRPPSRGGFGPPSRACRPTGCSSGSGQRASTDCCPRTTRGSSATSTAQLPRVCARPSVRSPSIPRRALPAALIGLAASLVAGVVLAGGGGGLTALDWLLYDRGLHGRGAAVSPALLVVARDPASEARFGAGPWDRAVLARLVVGLNRAGAAAIGVDIPLGPPSAPGRGGASSDALLSQATVLAGNVVYPITLDLHPLKTDLVPALSPSEAHPSWPLLPRVPLALPRAEPGAPLPGLARPATP